MNIVFSLTLIFADGYLGGSTHTEDFKSMAICNKQGARAALTYTGWGHPASFICEQVEARKRSTQKVVPVVVQHGSLGRIYPDDAPATQPIAR